MNSKNKFEPSFYDKVYEVTRKIPFGKVTSYGAIAEFLGRKGSARMVGYAMNNAHYLDDVPAHRVVNRNGLLTGKHHFSPPDLMQQLLENEGIEVENDKVLNFKEVFWKPEF
ncbi:MGMT family protein [Moheibacter lacus]|uniref:MGMT family protein n=1 Tax=Moheibacter lacus TaxID=2745851 RepID=A0A838ZGM4_9FLAO|nr:MGMT family protein [Moheibacter lacus]MBA5628418.1 MGMT family protein [Moheibacter lacus]